MNKKPAAINQFFNFAPARCSRAISMAPAQFSSRGATSQMPRIWRIRTL